MKWIVVSLLFFLTTGQSVAATQQLRPMETLKVPIKEIIAVLNDPSYSNAEMKNSQRNKIWKIARPHFNFDIISRKAIGKKGWRKFSPEEKSRFINVFSEFLGSTYIDKLQGEGEFQREQIQFYKELVKGKYAVVRTRLRRQSLELPIDYRMHLVDGEWKIYDILVDNGVSIVRNYRVQFASALRNGTPIELIERLEKKIAAQNAQALIQNNNKNK